MQHLVQLYSCHGELLVVLPALVRARSPESEYFPAMRPSSFVHPASSISIVHRRLSLL